MYKANHPHNNIQHEDFDDALKEALDFAKAHPGHETHVYDTGPGDYDRDPSRICLTVMITLPGVPFITHYIIDSEHYYEDHATLKEARQHAHGMQNLYPGMTVDINYNNSPHSVLVAPQAAQLRPYAHEEESE